MTIRTSAEEALVEKALGRDELQPRRAGGQDDGENLVRIEGDRRHHDAQFLRRAWDDRPRSAPDAVAIALESNTPPAEFVGSLRQLIRSFLPAGCPSAALLAHASGLPLRSFQRALALAGLSISDLVDQVRFQMATEMMHDQRARLIDIGLELGYSDAANFTRAFKRWTGQTPRLYRQTFA